jgi:hypothetical protein
MDFLIAMLAYDPSIRKSADELLSSDFILRMSRDEAFIANAFFHDDVEQMVENFESLDFS